MKVTELGFQTKRTQCFEEALRQAFWNRGRCNAIRRGKRGKQPKMGLKKNLKNASLAEFGSMIAAFLINTHYKTG